MTGPWLVYIESDECWSQGLCWFYDVVVGGFVELLDRSSRYRYLCTTLLCYRIYSNNSVAPDLSGQMNYLRRSRKLVRCYISPSYYVPR